jgi:hypothetical protein
MSELHVLNFFAVQLRLLHLDLLFGRLKFKIELFRDLKLTFSALHSNIFLNSMSCSRARFPGNSLPGV